MYVQETYRRKQCVHILGSVIKTHHLEGLHSILRNAQHSILMICLAFPLLNLDWLNHSTFLSAGWWHCILLSVSVRSHACASMSHSRMMCPPPSLLFLLTLCIGSPWFRSSSFFPAGWPVNSLDLPVTTPQCWNSGHL